NLAPAIAVDASGVPGNSSDFVIHDNNFYNNSAYFGSNVLDVFDQSAYDDTPDVRGNFWGDPSGPGGDGPGSGDKAYGAGRKRSRLQWLPPPGAPPHPPFLVETLTARQ